MNAKTGKLSVKTENIFPIIRQWLYSEKEIFLRELVSNAVDALNKRSHLIQLAEVEESDDALRVEVTLDTENKILEISDNGIGMTAEEVDRYINQIAYSGLVDFVERYQQSGSSGGQVIGHFGLGFYSAFMVANKVEIETLSSRKGNDPVHWESEEGIEFKMQKGDRQQIGTSIRLHLNEEVAKELSSFKVEELLRKYCSFMSQAIFYRLGKEEFRQVNNPHPLWLKKAKEVKDEEYIQFYKEYFHEEENPLFWIHLNLDFPFRLQGILYFPARYQPYLSQDGRIMVYSRQVFVADNMREMIPDYLFLLQGFLDCPDLPLNVSRSYLQSDQTVRKLSQHIVKKVADKLLEEFRNDGDLFEEMWPAISQFIKIASLQDPQFAEKVKELYLFKKTDGSYLEWEALSEGEHYYVENEKELEHDKRRLQAQGKDVFLMTEGILDIQWLSLVEMLSQAKIRFRRVDAGVDGEKDVDFVSEKLKESFSGIQISESFEFDAKKMPEESLPAVIIEDEEHRRMQEVLEAMKRVGESNFDGISIPETKRILILNTENRLSQVLKNLSEDESKVEESKKIARHIVDLALLSRHELEGDDLLRFIRENQEQILEKWTEN